MCRMLGLLLHPNDPGEIRDAVNTASLLLEAFLKASREDPYLARLGVPDPSHCHGWGYVVIWGTKEAYQGFEYARGDGGSCKENLAGLEYVVERLKALLEAKWDRLLVVVHARRAGRNEPRGLLHAHPFSLTVAFRHGPRTYYFAHNGSIRKDELARILGVDPSAYTDSFIGFYWLVKRLSYGGDIAGLYRRLASYTRTALDTILVEKTGSTASMYVTGYVGDVDEDRRQYYQPYLVRATGIVGYASSTIVDNVKGGVEAMVLEKKLAVIEWGEGLRETLSL